MSPLDTLPPDQQAVLSLLLKQGRSYDDIAALLRIDRESVRWRAHSAVNGLGPAATPDAPGDMHWQIIDYLLGQQSASERAATRDALEASPEDRAWARTVAAELRPIAADELPEIPAEAAEVDRAFEALDERTANEEQEAKSSRLGGLLLLGGLGVAIAVAVVLALTGGSSSNKHDAGVVTPPAKTTPASTTTPSSTPATAPAKTTPAKTTPAKTTKTTPSKTTTSTTSGVTPPAPKALATINLAAPGGAKTPLGAAEIFQVGTALEANIVAQGLPPGGNVFAYDVWLTSPTVGDDFRGFTPTVKAGGELKVLAPLPGNAGSFATIEVTKETVSAPSKPGTVVLSGAIPSSGIPDLSK
jgi:hypothetical protein